MCLNRRAASSPHQRQSLSVQRQLDSAEWGDKIPIGQIYRNLDPSPSLDSLDPALQAGPLVGQPYEISTETRKELIHEFM